MPCDTIAASHLSLGFTACSSVRYQHSQRPCLSHHIVGRHIRHGGECIQVGQLKSKLRTGNGPRRNEQLCRAHPLFVVGKQNDSGKGILSKVNGGTKWGVTLASSITLAVQRNENATWCICGSIVALYICKVPLSPAQLVL
jgi:hypothetical protein